MTTKIKLCRDCKHSRVEHGNFFTLSCMHPKVNVCNSFILASPEPIGSSAHEERKRAVWTIHGKSPCGMRGALWEPKQ